VTKEDRKSQRETEGVFKKMELRSILISRHCRWLAGDKGGKGLFFSFPPIIMLKRGHLRIYIKQEKKFK
jgi:hypothetical protein